MSRSLRDPDWNEAKLLKNMLIEFDLGGGGKTIERVLWVDRKAHSVVLIDVAEKSARDYRMDLADVVKALRCGSAKPADDPFHWLQKPKRCFSPARIKERNKRLDALRPFLDAKPEERFHPSTRRNLMQQIWNKARPGTHVCKAQAYWLVRIYLQRGQFDNALISDRANAGYTRERRKNSPPRKRPGRNYNARTHEEKRAGVVINEDLRATMTPAIVKLRETQERNGRKTKWKDVWTKICQIYYPSHSEVRKGVPVVIPFPKSQCPTIKQIKLLYYATSNVASGLLNREGEIAFNKHHRALKGDQRDLAYGPMRVVQIDFTIADIYLLNFLRTRILGRPTIVMIRDTFSRVIVGFAVGWRRESWAIASIAILNMVCDKVEFCHELGVKTTSEEWGTGLFETALTDNGALISYLTKHFRQSLNLQFENTGSGRGDLKPVVESGFDDLNEFLIYRLEGALHRTKDMREAQQSIKRARREALYTLKEFTAMIAEYCIQYNNHRLIKGYPISDDMAGKVASIPMHLWHYGITHRSGVPRQISIDKARLHCLCEGEATVRGDGIFFQGSFTSVIEPKGRGGR
jgi:hypothetical protein